MGVLSAWNCNNIYASAFKDLFLIYLLFSGCRILRTLFIFRPAKVLVQMVHNRKFQPQGFLIFLFLVVCGFSLHCKLKRVRSCLLPWERHSSVSNSLFGKIPVWQCHPNNRVSSFSEVNRAKATFPTITDFPHVNHLILFWANLQLLNTLVQLKVFMWSNWLFLLTLFDVTLWNGSKVLISSASVL